jgi:hypothetical protein
LNFDDVRTVGGRFINSDGRDREIGLAEVCTSYTLAEHFEIFGEAPLRCGGYSQSVHDDSRDRESTGYQLVAGTGLDVTGVSFLEVFVRGIRRLPQGKL